MVFKLDQIKRVAARDYERAWLETGELIERRGKLLKLERKGKPHALFELISRVRGILLKLGFTEVMVPTIVEQKEVQLQYGPEAPVILDRIFFLAGLDRPDVGLSKRRMEQIKQIIPGFKDFEGLRDILRRYKQGRISPDDFVETMVQELGIKEAQATALISLFKEFKELRPIPTSLTLRSHLSAGWFSVLRELVKREPLPLQLFSIGPKFRREQQLDPTHLYDSWTASLVVMAERMSLEDGQRLVKRILAELGFKRVKLRLKRATSKYYAPGTEFEAFVHHPKTKELVEVGDAGFYSPVALSNYGLAHPVFNFGLGLERLLMVSTGEEDIRALVYPYFYKPLELSDRELAAMLEFELKPQTQAGKRIAERVVKVAERRADEPSPCEFEVYRGKLLGKRVRVKLVEPEPGTKLVGPAGFNRLYVYQGNVIGLPERGVKLEGFAREAKERGTATGIRYLDGFAARAAYEIEQAVKRGKRRVKIRIRTAKLLSDLNLKLKEPGRRFITSWKKRIDVRGPVFTTVVAEVEG